jgi:RHH-type transcriptional regulator, rel operon repressor / antitoxin RelB
MLAIRLPQSIEKRLEKLARRTGRTKTYYVREAILEHLEEIEDLYLAEGALERIRSSRKRTIPLKQVMKRHGLQRCRSQQSGNSSKLDASQARRILKFLHQRVAKLDDPAASERRCTARGLRSSGNIV